jgi:uncharacterized membrane protein
VIPSAYEIAQKMENIRQLGDSIERAKAALKASPSYDTAVSLQRLERDRAELRRLLPPLRVV